MPQGATLAHIARCPVGHVVVRSGAGEGVYPASRGWSCAFTLTLLMLV